MRGPPDGGLRPYEPVDPFALERDFAANPLMATIKLARFKFVARMLSGGDVVADLGCGTGLSSYMYAHFCRSVIGVDLYADMAAVQERWRRDNLSFLQADLVEGLPAALGEAGVTAVTMVDVIEHFHRPDGEAIISRAAGLLQAGGMLIVGTPSKFSQAYRSEGSRHDHHHEYEPEELRALIGQHFRRTLLFSMNDETVHTGFSKLAWFFFVLAFK
jgi:2-polyprenyl-3-methyl-5-hydroxy-6-metoxy-1,4-benzoquinol methylase